MPPEDNHNIYDQDESSPVNWKRPDSSEKGSDYARGSRDNIRNQEESGSTSADNDTGFYRPDADERRRSSIDQANLALSELAGNKSGESFFSPNKDGKVRGFKSVKNTLKQRRKIIGAGGAAAGVGTILIASFFLLIPMKIEHIVNNLEKRFFSTSEDAMEKTTNRLLRGYLVKALPSYKTCGSTISKDCRAVITGNGPVNDLYRTWANARLENKLATNYGIEFKYDKFSRSWHLKAPGTGSVGDDIGPDGRGLNTDFDRADRTTMRRAVNQAMEGETRWKRVMYRYKVGRLLEAKYGIKRCIMYCGTRDALADKKDAKIRSAQIYLVQRVISPRTDSLGIVLECLLNPACSPEKTEPTNIGDQRGSPSEQENPETDTRVRTTLVELAGTYGLDDSGKLISQYEEISDKGFQKFLVEKVFEKIGLKTIAAQAANAVPVIGLMNGIAHIITLASVAGPVITKLGYITNSSAAAQTYMMYRTYSDETHTGHADATETGSMVRSLGPGNHGPANDPIKGGTASAEQTPLYQSIISGKSSGKTQSAFFNSVMPAKAHAESNSSDYICENGKPVPAGQLVCAEEVLVQTNPALNSSHEFLDQPGIKVVTEMSKGWVGAINGVAGVIGDFFRSIPGVGDAIESMAQLVSDILEPFFEKVVTILLPNPFGSNMSGGRTFDMMAAGADVSGNGYANIGLGGQELTDDQVAAIVNEREANDEANFATKSIFARMFDSGDQRSLISRVAMGVPLGTQVAAQSGVATLTNPLSGITQSFASIFSGKANAAITAQPDPFGVTQFGYPEGSIPDDPETYWDEHCSNKSEQSYQNDQDFQSTGGGKGWVGSAVNDPVSGMPVNKTVNPCLLIITAVGSAGGVYNTGLLTEFDKADQAGGNTVGQEEPTAVTGDAQELAKALVDSGRLTDEDGRYMAQIKAVANGNFTCNINPDILKMLYGVVIVDKHSVKISSLNRYCTGVTTASGSASYHYADGGGHAVDVTAFDGKPVDGGSGPGTLGYLKAAVKYLPTGTGFGQSNCGSGWTPPEGDDYFEDACNHQHIQVPKKKIGQQ